MTEQLTPCKEWSASKNRHGYGRVKRDGKAVYAHRVAYCESRGLTLDDIKGMCVRHKCDNPSCIEPAHLELGTQRQNIQDMMSRGRHHSALSPRDVEFIRSVYVPRHKEFGQVPLAKRFGVDQSTLSYLLSGRNWSSSGDRNQKVRNG